jgi:hypothetical protein
MSERSTPWVKAQASDAQGSCVEQRRHDGVVQVRDTKDGGTGPVIDLAPESYAAWVAAAKAGEFDHLV